MHFSFFLYKAEVFQVTPTQQNLHLKLLITPKSKRLIHRVRQQKNLLFLKNYS